LAPASGISNTDAVPALSYYAECSRVAARPKTTYMTAHSLIGLIEEMMDLKVQQYAESQMKLTPDLASILREKRETDKRRLEQIRTELVRFLET
jgi:hypothetical protein